MNKATYSQIQAVMRHYLKPGVPYRRKQVNRLVAMLDNIFIHEKNLGDSIERLGRKHIIGYWRRTCMNRKRFGPKSTVYFCTLLSRLTFH